MDAIPRRPDTAIPGRHLRADAARNQSCIVEAALKAFGESGMAVSVREIARRAGVGSGTVCRHFPTKEALFEAALRCGLAQLVDRAKELEAAEDPGSAFYDFFAFVALTGAAHRGLAESLSGAGFDLSQVKADTHDNLIGSLADLLSRAQAAGAVRADVDVEDVKALIVGCISRAASSEEGALERVIGVAAEGLRRQPSPSLR